MRKKLLCIQAELKSPKLQWNDFGKYNYRSCEDILEAVKPLCFKYNCCLTLSDEIVEVGKRIYVKAIARIEDNEKGSDCVVQVSAYAREAEVKKGMDESQITGAASSYARKYALNGLFCIDDTKDSDATNDHSKDNNSLQKGNQESALKIIQKAKTKEDLQKFISIRGQRMWTTDELEEQDNLIATIRIAIEYEKFGV